MSDTAEHRFQRSSDTPPLNRRVWLYVPIFAIAALIEWAVGHLLH